MTTLSLTLNSNYTFRYLYVANSWDNSVAEYATGYCENLNLNAPAPATESASGLWPREYYISGYLPRYQRRQIVGYHAASGDLRPVEVNASGHLFMDIEVGVSSGLFVDGVSGVHVYVESGVHVVADIAESGMGVNVQSGLHVQVSGQHVFVESGNWVVMSGQGVLVQSGLHTQVSGQHLEAEEGHTVAARQGVHPRA